MNSSVVTILEILKYVLPSAVVLIACLMLVKRFLQADIKTKQISLLKDTQDVTVRLRLQAYERLVLFIERIHPRQIVPRVYQSGMTVGDLQQALIITIQSEFEHNLAQQIYVTRKVWETVRGVKEQEMNMISQIAKQLDPAAPAKELHLRIVDYVMTVENELPTDIALQVINEEARLVLNYGAQG